MEDFAMNSMLPYKSNNIIFRISSSDSIGKFKQSQAMAFVQLARSDLNFDVSAREVVLLEYDRFSQWIYRMERVLQSAGEGHLSEQLREAVIESLNAEISTIDGILQANSSIFTTKVAVFTKIIHIYSSYFMSHKLRVDLDDQIHRAFKSLTDMVSNYLQHLLMCLHEYNANIIIKVRPPFISISDFELQLNSLDLSSVSDDAHKQFKCLGIRMKFFIENGCGKTYELKDYTFGSSLFDSIKQEFNSEDIELIPERLNKIDANSLNNKEISNA